MAAAAARAVPGALTEPIVAAARGARRSVCGVAADALTDGAAAAGSGRAAVSMLGVGGVRSGASPVGRAVRAAATGDSARVRFGLAIRAAVVLPVAARDSRADRRAGALFGVALSELSEFAAGDEAGDPGWESSAAATPGTASDRPRTTAAAPSGAAHLNVDSTAPPFRDSPGKHRIYRCSNACVNMTTPSDQCFPGPTS